MCCSKEGPACPALLVVITVCDAWTETAVMQDYITMATDEGAGEVLRDHMWRNMLSLAQIEPAT